MNDSNPPTNRSINTSQALVNQSVISDLDISLHPLPILNISDHFTRRRLDSPNASVEIYGALIGTQVGKKIEIVNCFEILVNQDGKVDCGFLKTRKEQFQQVFPTLDLLGWYTNAEQPRARDVNIQNQLIESVDFSTPVILFYHPSLSMSSTTNKELPIQIYEFSQSSLTDGEVLVKCTFDIQTSEAERIAVDYVAKPNAGSKESGLIANLTTQKNAIHMLHHKLDTIVNYLDQLMNSNLDDGETQIDHGLLREISSLVASLPKPDENPSFVKEYMTESSDALLTSYLSSQTKTLNQTNQLIDRYLYLNSRENNPSKFGMNANHSTNTNKAIKMQK